MFIIKIPNDWIRTVHVEAIALPTEPQSLPLVIVCLPSENWLLTQPPRMVKAMYLPTYLPTYLLSAILINNLIFVFCDPKKWLLIETNLSLTHSRLTQEDGDSSTLTIRQLKFLIC